MFTGFTPETIDFLWGIRLNNNREWFTEHKKQYIQTLYEPMKALGQDLFRLVADRPGTLVKVSRIYRDARLHHPVPYKESLWICIRQDVAWWAENPCLYFEINHDRVHYGFLYWKPRPATLEDFRSRIAGRPEEFLSLIAATEEAVGQPVTAECYKRPKVAPLPELERFYAWKGQIGCVREEEISPELFGPALGERVAEFLEKLLPLYDYFSRYTV